MQRAFARLETKAIEETPDAYFISGIASTPTTDRMGDVVEPMGAQFGSLPKLFLHHDTTLPIGSLTDAKPNAKGIPFKARIPKVAEPGIVQDRINEAVHSIKYDLLSYVSIGFQPKDTEPTKTGYRFKEWDWLELSVVGVPANPDAVITGIKSIDDELHAARVKSLDGTPAASGRKASPVLLIPPGASGKQPSKPPEGKAMKVQDQITALQATRQAKDARMEAIMKTAADEGRVTTKEEAEEYDDLAIEVKSIDGDLKRLADRQKSLAETAEPVQADSRRDDEPKVRYGDGRLVSPKLEKGVGFTRMCGALALSKGNRAEAAQFAKSKWGDSHPEIATMLSIPEAVLRSAVTVGSSTDSSFASALVQYNNLASEFVDYLRPATIIGKMPGLRKVPFNIRFPSQTGAVSVGWVGQGNAAPASSPVFATNTIGFAKLSAIVAVTEELAMFSSPSAEALLRDDLTKSVASYMDQQFIDPSVAASANVSPAAITNGVTVSQASANPVTLASIETDVAAVFGNLIAANVPMEGLVWVMTPTSALYISQIRTTNGPYAFPDINVGGGMFKGFPVITSNQVPHTTSGGSIIVLTRPEDVFMADEGGVQIDASQEASVQMNTAPSNSAASLLSLWQSGLLGIRITKVVNWQRRRDASTTYLDNVHFIAN